MADGSIVTPLRIGGTSQNEITDLQEFKTNEVVSRAHGGTGKNATDEANLLLQLGAAGPLVGGFVPAGQLPDAVPGTKGALRLTEDLGGTATAPKVVGIGGAALTQDPSAALDGQYLQVQEDSYGNIEIGYGPGGTGGVATPNGVKYDVQWYDEDGSTPPNPIMGGGDDLQKITVSSVTRLVLGNATNRGVLRLTPRAGDPTSQQGDIWCKTNEGFYCNTGSGAQALGVPVDTAGLIPVTLTRAREWTRHRYIVQATPDVPGYATWGAGSALSTLGYLSAAEDVTYDPTSGPWITHVSEYGAGASGVGAGVVSGSFNLVKARWLPDISFKVGPPSSAPAGDYRYIVGLFSGNPQQLDIVDPSSAGSWEPTEDIWASGLRYVCFFVDSSPNSIYDNGNWWIATWDARQSTPSSYYTNTAIPFISGGTNDNKLLRIRFVSTTSVEFYINDVRFGNALTTSTHKIPQEDTAFGIVCMGIHRDESSAPVIFSIQRIVLEYGR